MRQLLALFLFQLSAALTAAALTVAAYNVENYTLADRMVDGVFRPAYPKPEKEKIALRQVITGMAPDILAIEEMGPQAFLDDFQRELKQAGQDFPHAVVLEAADADRHVAVLSKVPFKEVRRHAKVPVTYFGQPEVVKRGVLEVVFATAAGDFSLFVVHLKSKHTERKDDPESAQQRALEAEAVRDLVLARHPDPAKGKFIVCGDWNDTRNSRPVQAMQKRGETIIGELVPAADSRGEEWTHFYRRDATYRRIDYLMVSPALKSLVADGRAKIWDGPGAPAASDHRAVYLQLRVDPVR
ncbi:MAG: endonuclease/exonuclease/phosphatase family protein [Opitutae bacterium]|nr:endonuclease/exonuclease/phosphatase family protein [Opitutae bacterium]